VPCRQSSEPLDPKDITARLRTALAAAEAFVARMPTAKMGLLFLKDGEAVQPDPDRLEYYQTHAGQRRGQWPSNPESSHVRAVQQEARPLTTDILCKSSALFSSQQQSR
jgi:hypothetical protein